MVSIKTRCCGTVICSGRTFRLALETAAAQGVSLKYADLRGQNLSGLNLRRIDLQHADLDEANLGGSDLSYASLVFTTLQNTDLRGARISGTHFKVGSQEGHLIPVSYNELSDMGAII